MNIAVGVYAARVRGLAITFGAWLAVGCGSAPAGPGPEQTVADLAAALRSGDAATVATLTGRAEPQVHAALQVDGNELHALGETLARAPVDRGALAHLTDSGVVVLVRDGESWRVDRGILGRPALARPVDAVLAFHDALARSRMQSVVALMSRAARAELDLEVGRWLTGTADPDALEITVTGESAIVTTPLGDHLELVRESGEWHVVELR